MARTELSALEVRGWEVLRLASDDVAVDVVPGKGGDILSLWWRPAELDVLWKTPWGLRAKGTVSTGADAFTAFIEAYPGGWQTIFPNGGNPVVEDGVTLGFHGEACLASWDAEPIANGVALCTQLTRSPFALRKEVTLADRVLVVRETARNTGGSARDVMWSHHPAFGAPFLDAHCTLDCGATRFVADDGYDTPNGDLLPGATSSWPKVAATDGSTVDLRSVPDRAAAVDRLGYLVDFDDNWFAITNPELPLRVTVRWDRDVFSSAWYWFEGGGSAAFPWFQQAYVLAVEPATSYPGQGLHTARATTGSTLCFEPGEEKTVTLQVELSADIERA